VIDWDKVKTVNDIKEILMGLGITVEPEKLPKNSKLNKYIIKMVQ
jgi:hypothetical protein